jgi:hypothetical protein
MTDQLAIHETALAAEFFTGAVKVSRVDLTSSLPI